MLKILIFWLLKSNKNIKDSAKVFTSKYYYGKYNLFMIVRENIENLYFFVNILNKLSLTT